MIFNNILGFHSTAWDLWEYLCDRTISLYFLYYQVSKHKFHLFLHIFRTILIHEYKLRNDCSKLLVELASEIKKGFSLNTDSVIEMLGV